MESEFPEVPELVGSIIRQREEGMDTESAISKLAVHVRRFGVPSKQNPANYESLGLETHHGGHSKELWFAAIWVESGVCEPMWWVNDYKKHLFCSCSQSDLILEPLNWLWISAKIITFWSPFFLICNLGIIFLSYSFVRNKWEYAYKVPSIEHGTG